jgi:hypothetical protein
MTSFCGSIHRQAAPLDPVWQLPGCLQLLQTSQITLAGES